MTKKIVAIAGGENGRYKSDGTKTLYETGLMDQEIIKLTGKSQPNFLFLAHSHPQSLDIQEDYFQVMKNIYEGKYNCNCKILRTDRIQDKKYVEELIAWADIIYEGGGNTFDMIDLWHKTGFDKLLKHSWKQGKVLCGVSAGACCWFESCSSDSLKLKYGSESLIDVSCLGFYKGFFVPHCDEDGRRESAKDLLKGKNMMGLLLSNGVALEIIDDKYRLIKSDTIKIKPFAFKAYWQDNKYIEEEIIISQEFKDISKLYERRNDE